MTTADYTKEFDDALAWGQANLGLPPTTFKIQPLKRKLISRDTINRLMRRYFAFPQFANSKLGFSGMSCLQSSLIMQPIVSPIVGGTAIVTVGYAIFEGDTVFYFDKSKIKQWVEHEGSVLQNNLHLHTWITLDTGEIVDFTLAAGMAIHLKDSKPGWEEKANRLIQNPFMGTVEHLFEKRKVEYHPLGVDEPFVRKIGIKF